MRKVISAFTVVALAVSMLLVLSGCTKTIKLDKYIVFEAEGANGYGKATAYIDTKALQSDFGDKVEKTDEASRKFDKYGRYKLSEAVEMTVDLKLSEDRKLSNGDVVTVSLDADSLKYLEAYDVELSYQDEITFTVEGLSEVTTFDAFKDVEVIFEGYSSDGYAYIDLADDSELDYDDFEIDVRDGLANGDVVTVSIDEYAIEQHIEDYGSAPAETEKTYTVSGLAFYASTLSDIPDTELQKIKDTASQTFDDRVASWWDSPEECTGKNYIGCYFLNSNDYLGDNKLYLIYKVDVTTASQSFSYYWYYKVSYVEINAGAVNYVNPTYPEAHDYFFYVSGEIFKKGDNYYEGYETLDGLYDNCVDIYAAEYSVEGNISE